MGGSARETTSDTDALDARGLAQKGAFNVVLGVLGRPGSGKSYFASTRARELAERGCFVLCHDIGWRLPERDAEGRPFGIVRHETTASAVERLARDPRGIHCISSPDAAEVIDLARRLAAADLKRNGGTCGHPVVVVIDEVVAADVCDPNYLSDDMRKLISGRRHENVGIIWTCQSARMVHNQLISLSTEMVLFNLIAEKDLKKLEENGIPPEEVAKVRALPKYQHVQWRFQ